VRRFALVALVAAAATLTPAAAATTKPSVGRLWHAFPLGHGRLVHAPQAPQPQPRPQKPRPGERRPTTRRHTVSHGPDTLTAALAGSGTALTVIALIVLGRRRGWTGRPAEPDWAPERRAGTAPRVLAFYAVAAAIGVIVGLLIPLVA
jgi:hypothetical protein